MTGKRLPKRTPAQQRAHREAAKRFDIAVDILLNSGLLAPHMDDFWAFVDGEIDEGEARRRLPS